MTEGEILEAANALLAPQLRSNFYEYRINNIMSDYNAISRLEQMGSTQNSMSSLEEAHEEISVGARKNGKMSAVRRFFCLFVLFDLLFISLTWLLCVMLMGSDKLIDILKSQVLHYKISSSIFDIVLAAFCRFTILLLFYGLLQLNTTFFVASTTLATCVFLIFKVIYYSWDAASQPVFQVILVLISFVIAWTEAWFLDFRVLPQELSALTYAQIKVPLSYFHVSGLSCLAASVFKFSSSNQRLSWAFTFVAFREKFKLDLGMVVLRIYFLFGACIQYLATGRFSESLSTLLLDRNTRSPVMRQFLQDMASQIGAPTESNGNFYSPLESSNASGDESDDQKLDKNSEYLRRGKDTLEVAWSILNDCDWKLHKTSSDGDCVYSKYEAHLGKVFLLKAKMNINAQKLLEELFLNVDKFTLWNKTVVESRRVLVIDEHTDITYQVSSPGGNGFISSRDFVNLRHWDMKGDCYVLAGISIPYPGLPSFKQYIRGENGPCCWAMRSLGEKYDSCMFEFLLNTNLKLKGWIPQYVLETALTSILFEYSACLKEYCKTINQAEST